MADLDLIALASAHGANVDFEPVIEFASVEQLRNFCIDVIATTPTAPASAQGAEPFVVRHYSTDERPTIKGNGFDGLEIGQDRDEAEAFVAWVNARLGVGK